MLYSIEVRDIYLRYKSKFITYRNSDLGKKG